MTLGVFCGNVFLVKNELNLETKPASSKSTVQKYWDVLKIILALLGLFYLFSQTNYQQLLALRYKFSWNWFVLASFLFLLTLGFKALQYYIFIGRKITYFHTLEIIIIQNLITNFVATVAGIASYLALLGVEKDVRLGKATESFVLVKIGDVLAAFTVLVFASLFVKPIPPEARAVLFVTYVFVLVFLLSLIFLIFFRGHFVDVVKKILVFLKIDHFLLVQNGINYLEKIAAYRQSTMLRSIGISSLLSLAYIGTTVFLAYARLRTLSLSIDIFVVIFIFSILQFASWLPIYVLGGLGVSEGMLIYLLGLFDVNPVGLAAILIGVRVIIYLLRASTIIYLPIRAAFLKLSPAK